MTVTLEHGNEKTNMKVFLTVSPSIFLICLGCCFLSEHGAIILVLGLVTLVLNILNLTRNSDYVLKKNEK